MIHRYGKKHPSAPRWIGPGLLILLLVLGARTTHAQGLEVQGVVQSASNGEPLPGVNIVEVGTQNGTISTTDGTFSLEVSGPNAQLSASFVGFITQTVDVNGRNEITINMEEDTQLLDEVVVTAFGIERKTRAVGFSVSEVGGEDLRVARENNVANALSGKVAGVSVSKPASGPAGSSRVVIRGNTSLEGNNQPLYVVDGVPIDNSTLGSAGMWGGVDQGDGISSINPDDIENISVLKGPAAAALYGTRAQNGVVLITTKTGRGSGGLGIEFNSNTTFEDALVGYSDYQTQYGQGSRGAKPTSLDEALGTGQISWGARLDGTPVIQFDGQMHPYSLVEDKLDRFYRTGLTTTNTLALTGGTQTSSFRFSASHLNSESIVPNSGLERISLSLRGTADFGSRLSADVKANYVREDVNNRTGLSDSPGNPNYTIARLPTNVDPETMKPGHVPGDELQELGYSTGIFQTNSYWATNYFVNDDFEDRLIGFAQLRYEFTDWLSLQGRVGQDAYSTRRTNVTPYGTRYQPEGSMREFETSILERNWDFLVTADRDVTPDFGVVATFGGNKLRQRREDIDVGGNTFNIPGLVTVTNLANQTSGYGISEKEINSLYGSAEFSFRDYLFLTVTGRNDWSSTLPLDNNSYFYPSVSGSFVFSDAFAVPSWLTFGKIRGSWAEVGGDTDPYRLSLTYALTPFTHQGQPLGYIAQDQIPLADLKPSSSVGKEFGFDVRLLDSRVGIDFTWYDQRTTNQILSTTVPQSSGYGAKVINAGEMRNTGVELLLNLTPVRTGDVRWDVDFNFARNKNEVVELFEGLESLNLDQARSQTAWIVAQVGEPFSTIRGYAYQRDANGNIVLDAGGVPVQGELRPLGVGIPDWTGGLTNTFRYKNFTASALIDISWGGELFSGTNQVAYAAGLHENTLEGRVECEAVGYDANDGNGCWVAPGVDANGNRNTTATFPETYFGGIASRIAEEFIYDASYVKLRELQFSYRLPPSWLRQSPFELVTVSLVGRNLWLIHSKVPNVDPESTYNNTNAQGFEWTGVPQTRSIGFNVNVRL